MRSEALRHEQGQLPAEELSGRVAEHLLSGPIQEEYPAIAINTDDGVHGGPAEDVEQVVAFPNIPAHRSVSFKPAIFPQTTGCNDPLQV